ncbi:hypothetical protein Hanom_Chr16g01480421 [Helianthus anomalus]
MGVCVCDLAGNPAPVAGRYGCQTGDEGERKQRGFRYEPVLCMCVFEKVYVLV